MKWVVRKTVAPLGQAFYTYLRGNSSVLSSFQCWDELHDATVFNSFLSAAWHGLKNFGRPVRLDKQPSNPWR